MIKVVAKGINYLFGNVLHKQKTVITSSLNYLDRNRKLDRNYFDYIRLATLELVSNEIEQKGLKGNVAELGVYKGKFARYINSYFPARKLYLFDTFKGFDDKDVSIEKEKNYSGGTQDFSDTSVDAVLSLMPAKHNCIPVKGFFPESAKEVNDEFVFISIDADLYQPIYNGLQYFYPRLVAGGYIFVHDFNNDQYKGARKAVMQFCEEQKIGYLPLPDVGGSAIIMK
jgi:O-methyltransferase